MHSSTVDAASAAVRPGCAARPPYEFMRHFMRDSRWVGKAADVDLTDVAAALGDWGWDVTI